MTHKCEFDFDCSDDHDLLGTVWRRSESDPPLTIRAVREPSCEKNGTPYTWVILAEGDPHPLDWRTLGSVLREYELISAPLGDRLMERLERQVVEEAHNLERDA